jgi:hypothetical protein
MGSHLQNNQNKRTGGVAEVVEYLFHKCEAKLKAQFPPPHTQNKQNLTNGNQNLYLVLTSTHHCPYTEYLNKGFSVASLL